MTHSLPFALQHLIDAFLQKQLPFVQYRENRLRKKNTLPEEVNVSELHLCDSNMVRPWAERAQLTEQPHAVFPVWCWELVHSHQRFIPEDDRISTVRRILQSHLLHQLDGLAITHIQIACVSCT